MSKGENTPWMKAIIQVLQQAAKPMHYTEIAQAILDQKLRKDFGATPAATVNANIAWDIKHRPSETLFARVEPGVFALLQGAGGAATPTTPPEPPPEAQKEAVEESAGIIQAFGMFWRRDRVRWSNNPELLGQQQQVTKIVDFNDQRGVYLLHDGQRVVYVGQVADQPLGRRLYQHTADRLNGRWDRFSWFGIRRVTQEGQLVDVDLKTLTAADIITALEALLIEGLEPPQNRQRGKDFSAVEYLQANRQRALLIEAMHELFRAYDAVITLTGGRQLMITNLTGHPAISVPNGFDKKGRPTSFTLLGNLYDEGSILALARAYQLATEFEEQHPPKFEK
jgi:hypothetical protein